jgi:3-phosphoshikimate 1-carboxyvinyltransferase
MSPHDPLAHPLVVERSPWLRGRLSVPGDRSVSRLALILGAMARGETVIEGLCEAPGVLAAADMLQMLGARIDRRSGRWHVMGLGTGGFLEPEAGLQFGDAATTLHLAMGLVGIYDFPSRFVGDPWLAAQPLQHMLEPLAVLGIEVLEGSLEGLPLTLRGPRLPVPPVFEVPTGAPQLKDTMLLAALAIPGTTEVSERRATPDHAERLLLGFGAHIERSTDSQGRHTVALDGLPALRAQRIAVPGDPTLAAFAIVAALIVPGSEVVIEAVSVNPTRSILLASLIEMGADIELQARRSSSGEDVADLRVRHSALTGIAISAADAASTAAEYAALAVAAGFAAGPTRLEGLQQLPAPLRHRLPGLAEALQASGVDCRLDADRLEIVGGGSVRGGAQVTVHIDPWAALALLVLGMAAENATTIDDGAVLETCFPGFVSGLESIGASFVSPLGTSTRVEVSG